MFFFFFHQIILESNDVPLINECKFENISFIIRNNFYSCKNYSIFLPIQRVCDGTRDCPNGDDEFMCIEENQFLFKCNQNDEFVYLHRVCDYINDCKNGEDERFCRKKISVLN